MPRRPIKDYEGADDGMRQMWAAVLLRAIHDAAGISMNCDGQNRQFVRKEAKAWMDNGGKDFRAVCSLAGLDPDFIHDAWRSGRLSYERLKAITVEDVRAAKRRKTV